MPRCNCGTQTCGCRIQEGTGVTITGAGTPRDPWVVSAAGGGSESGWLPGDLKDTARSVTDPGWLECNGQAVSRTTYADLFAAIGTTWGPGNGTSTFNVPNFAGTFRAGAGAGYALGSSGGAAATVLSVENLPPHTHTISHNHTMAHTHSINHDHPAVDTSNAGNHAHDLNRSNSEGTNNGTFRRGGSADGETSTSTEGLHQHTVNIPTFTGSSGGSSAANTGGPSVPNSGSTGDGDSFTNLPPYRAVRVLIKT